MTSLIFNTSSDFLVDNGQQGLQHTFMLLKSVHHDPDSDEDSPLGSSASADNCDYKLKDTLDVRFALIALLAGSICCLGVIGNVVSIYVLTRSRMQTTNNWFLVLLAFFDIGVLSCSFLIYIVKMIYEYNQALALYELWFSYIKPITLWMCICQGGAAYATAAATIERYLFVKNARTERGCLCTNSQVAVASALLLVFVVALQMPKYFETEVIVVEHCPAFNRYDLVPSWLLRNRSYVAIYSVWVSNILFVFMPFAVLLVLNLSIFYKVTQKWPERRTTVLTPWLQRMQQRILKRKTKQATVVLLVIVLVFLICNLPSVIVTFLEHVAPEVFTNQRAVYHFSKDLVTILTIVNSSATFLVYVAFGRHYRKEIRRIPAKIRRRLPWNRKKNKFLEDADHEEQNNHNNNNLDAADMVKDGNGSNGLYRTLRKDNNNRLNMEPVDLLVPSRGPHGRRNACAFIGANLQLPTGVCIFEALP